MTGRRTLLRAVFVLWVLNLGLAAATAWPVAAGRPGGGLLAGAHFWMAFASQFATLHTLAAIVAAALVAARPRRWVLAGLVPALWGFWHFVLYVDHSIYMLYRFHINASVISLLTTPGVGDNLQFSPWFLSKFAAALALFVAAELGLARWALRAVSATPPRVRTGLRQALVAAAALALFVAAEKAVYTVADLRSHRDVLLNVRALPMYRAVTMKRWARKLGVEVSRERRLDSGTGLRYPLVPVPPPAPDARLSVLWILIEGFRFDMLDPAVTPNIAAFASGALVGTRHYSSGNATRCGVFGLFYGLHGSYWHPFLANRQGPVLLRALGDAGYEFHAMGTASFSNPEFRHTCFVDLPPEVLHDHYAGESTPERDHALSRDLLAYLERSTPDRPFFAFAFLDAPHAYRYRLLPGFTPPHPEVAQADYTDYTRLPKDKDLQRQTFLRYRNSLAYVDFLLTDVFAALRGRGLLDRTIVMVAGDHGEEFGENGRFGHNNAFDEWQTRTAFVFHHPGVRPGRIERLTSHADVVPTVMRLLGVRTPPETYCQGVDMLGGTARDHVVSASWSDLAILDGDGTSIVFSLGGFNASTLDVFDRAYRPVADRGPVLQRHAAALDAVLRASRQFKR